MKYYSKEQFAILSYLNAHDYLTVDDVNRSDCNLLYKDELITMGFDNSLPDRPFVARLAAEGKAYLSTLEHTTTHEDETIKVSKQSNRIALAALIVALFALLKSYGIIDIILKVL